MVEGKTSANPIKKLTPKALIHQKFGDKACYEVEEVQDSASNPCPGLVIQQKGPIFYRCTLKLPETSVVSNVCKKKKDAEQSAAEKAIEKLGIRQTEYNPTVEEAWNDLASRLAFLFGNEFLSKPNPLSGHFRAALYREGEFNSCIPISVIALYDPKINNICKYIDGASQSNFLLLMSLVQKAASKLTELVLQSNEGFSLQKKTPYPPEIMQSSINHELEANQNAPLQAILIPSSADKPVEPLMLNITSTGYYLDVIAKGLGMTEASEILFSRPIGKATSEMRIYYSSPKILPLEECSQPQLKQVSYLEGSLNARATYLSGQAVYGDAILASAGYSWRSTDLVKEEVSLRTYYRIIVNMMPSGAHIISREAILAAKLPTGFTTRSNCRGSFPRDVLCTFCRFHHLSEPVFSTENDSSSSTRSFTGPHKKLKVTESEEEEKSGTGSKGVFNCEVKIFSKNQELILHCSPQESYEKHTDAVQNSALKVLSWLNIFFEEPNTPLEELKLLGEKLDIHFTPGFFFKEFALCHPVHKCMSTKSLACTVLNLYRKDCAEEEYKPLTAADSQHSGVGPLNGSLACISYSVSLITDGDCIKELLESCEELEFEVGNEAVLPQIELATSHLDVGQSAQFQTELPSSEFILAAASNSASTLSLLSSRNCKLEYNLSLLRVTEPMEERMEQALFSPPLSKQRVDFALQQIKNSSATSLVDFGCGSGSLLDGLLLCPTSLEKIAGVDISQKGLARAAKSLHTKLNKLLDTKEPGFQIKSAVLYDGSITKFDSRLHGFDIATCLEVIEHMEEEDASLFGDVVLSSFHPHILIVSTPNYEYNVILQKSSPQNLEEEKNQPCKFRNHDHKFEWTRAQFETWASELALKHNYSVEFSGVGGTLGVEPGFASQIAIFNRNEDNVVCSELAHYYDIIWKWSFP